MLSGARHVIRGIGLVPVLEEPTQREESWPTATSGAGDGMGTLSCLVATQNADASVLAVVNE